MNTAYKKGLDESCEGKTMKKKVLIFWLQFFWQYYSEEYWEALAEMN